jgi:predicted esterase
MAISYQYKPPLNLKSRKILCVFHGLGSNPFDLIPVVDFATDYHRYFFGAPQRSMPLFGGQSCSSWYTWQQPFAFTQHNRMEMDLLLSQAVEILQNHHPDLRSFEIHALGFSQGGVMALRLSLKLPLATLGFFSSFYDFSDESEHDLQLENTLILGSYSACDEIVPSPLSIKALKTLSLLALDTEEYSDPLLGHSINQKLMAHYKEFLQG